MHHPLIATIVIGLVLAFILGAVANRLRISPLVGYLLAGVIVGPFTPGFVADQALAPELAEIGVILLMFGVGMHFSVKDLMSVKAIALPGALVQISLATILGMGLAWAVGWSMPAGFVFGLALSTASTVVLLRALQERRLLETNRGRIAIGWLIVEDVAMVLALVLLPVFSHYINGETADGQTISSEDIFMAIAVTLGKVIAFVALMLIVGRRVIPWLLHYVAHTGSRELFRLAVLAIALGIAFGSAQLFGVSFALGAFFAGMVMGESELSHQAAAETLPLRDAFAVLFFVSVGMLFDPSILVRDPLLVLGTVFIILFGKSVGAFLIVLAFRHPIGTALTISASLAQIGEFSFILAGLGVSLELLPERGRDLVLAGALLSIMLNPVFFKLIDIYLAREKRQQTEAAEAIQTEKAAVTKEELPVTTMTDHAVVVGFGRVGQLVVTGLETQAIPHLIIEEADQQTERARQEGHETIFGNANDDRVIKAANLARAKWLFVAIPHGFEAGGLIARARAINPGLNIIARAHSDAEVEHLEHHGADIVIMGEREIAAAMLSRMMGEEKPASDPPLAPAPKPI